MKRKLLKRRCRTYANAYWGKPHPTKGRDTKHGRCTRLEMYYRSAGGNGRRIWGSYGKTCQGYEPAEWANGQVEKSVPYKHHGFHL